MADLAVGDVWECALISHCNNQAGIVVRQFRVFSAGLGVVTDAELASAVDLTYAPKFKALMSNSAQWLGVRVARLRPLPRTAAVASLASTGFGTVASDVLPKQTAGIITLQTEFAGRKYRGRAYIPFPPETQSDLNGVPLAAYLVNLNALANEMKSTIAVTGAAGIASIQPVIWHRTTATTHDIIATRANLRWATQRRRGDYGRTNLPNV